MQRCDLSRSDFTKSELEEIITRGLVLMQRGYTTALNYVQSQHLPINGIVFHYLQDSRKHIEHIRKKLGRRVKTFTVPRLTFYRFDPIYATKPKFREEYERATFYDEDLQKIPIEEVVKNPKRTEIVSMDEYDLIIPFDTQQHVRPLAARLRRLARTGPDQWIHPAIIIRSEEPLPRMPWFALKDYAAMMKARLSFIQSFQIAEGLGIWNYTSIKYAKNCNQRQILDCEEIL